MIQKTNDSNSIKFFEDALFGKKAEAKEAKTVKAEKPEPKPIGTKKLDNSKALNTRNGGSFLFAGDGFAPDGGSPTKYVGINTNNSIWDSGVVSRLADKKGGDEIIRESKQNRKNIKEEMKNKQIDSMVEAVQNIDTRKSSSIAASSSDFSEKRYKAPSNSISIFDTDKNFSRVPEKTEGEKIVESNRVPKVKDKTSMYARTTHTSNLMDSLFDNLTKKK